MGIDIKIDAQSLSTEITQLLDKDYINSIARETGFILREGKIDGFIFLDMLLFTHFNFKDLSLEHIASQIDKRFKIKISKQSLDERFSNRAVEFFRTILEKALQIKISKNYCIDFLVQEKVLIKDATSFQLPETMKGKYKGSGGSASNASIKIQFEYDLITGKITDLSLSPFVVQDQTNATITVDNINSNELIIRDLGYINIPVLRAIEEKGAFYLNRLQSNVNVYELKKGKPVLLDFASLYESMKIKGLNVIEKDVIIGAKEQLKTRMIIERIPDKNYQERIRTAEKNARKKGYQLTKKYKARQAMNIFTTNTDISHKDIRVLYTLRWQIELMFKIWKSIGEIHQVKKMKVTRFECCLFAKLIWLVLNWDIMRLTVNYYYQEMKIKTSPYKLFRTLKSNNFDFRRALINSEECVLDYILEFVELCSANHSSERKKGSTTWSYDLYEMLKRKYNK